MFLVRMGFLVGVGLIASGDAVADDLIREQNRCHGLWTDCTDECARTWIAAEENLDIHTPAWDHRRGIFTDCKISCGETNRECLDRLERQTGQQTSSGGGGLSATEAASLSKELNSTIDGIGSILRSLEASVAPLEETMSQVGSPDHRSVVTALEVQWEIDFESAKSESLEFTSTYQKTVDLTEKMTSMGVETTSANKKLKGQLDRLEVVVQKLRVLEQGLSLIKADQLYYGDDGTLTYWVDAIPLYKQACLAGKARACLEYAHELRISTNGAWERNRVEVAPWVSPAVVAEVNAQCERSDARSCNRLGWYFAAWHVPDYARAATLYEKACDMGESRGCVMLGMLYFQGAGVEKAETRTFSLMKKACDMGGGYGCFNLGLMYKDGTGRPAALVAYGGVEKDIAQAATLYEKACDLGDGSGCIELGVLYLNGIPFSSVIQKDEARAVTLFEKACDRGYSVGCNKLGILYRDGDGVQQDVARSQELFQKACYLGHPDCQ